MIFYEILLQLTFYFLWGSEICIPLQIILTKTERTILELQLRRIKKDAKKIN